jgi:threonine dehydrogenase-like Zn-dependent dehydrogenase
MPPEEEKRQFANLMRADWKELLEMVESGDADPTIMLTHRIRIDDIAKAYTLQEKRAQGWVKCFVETRFSAKRAEGTPELVRL